MWRVTDTGAVRQQAWRDRTRAAGRRTVTVVVDEEDVGLVRELARRLRNLEEGPRKRLYRGVLLRAGGHEG